MGASGQKEIVQRMFVQPDVRSDAAVSTTHRETPLECAVDDVENKEPIRTKRNPPPGELARIAIKANGRIFFMDPIEMLVAKAQGNYVALVHKSGTHLVRETIATVERKLTPLGFVRIHRSILVNPTLVKELRRNTKGTYVLLTMDGSEHPVGRAYKNNLKMIARSWLGVDLNVTTTR